MRISGHAHLRGQTRTKESWSDGNAYFGAVSLRFRTFTLGEAPPRFCVLTHNFRGGDRAWLKLSRTARKTDGSPTMLQWCRNASLRVRLDIDRTSSWLSRTVQALVFVSSFVDNCQQTRPLWCSVEEEDMTLRPNENEGELERGESEFWRSLASISDFHPPRSSTTVLCAYTQSSWRRPSMAEGFVDCSENG